MNKRERDRIKREKLDNMLKDNPKLDEIISNMVDNSDDTVKKAVENAIEKQLQDAQTRGILIGSQAYTLTVIENLNKFQTIEEAREYYQKEADRLKSKMGLK